MLYRLSERTVEKDHVPNLAMYAEADSEDAAFDKFEAVCGHLPRKEFKVIPVDAIPEDQEVL